LEVVVRSGVKSRDDEGSGGGGSLGDNNIDPNSSGVGTVGNVPGGVGDIGPEEGDGVDALGNNLQVLWLDNGSGS